MDSLTQFALGATVNVAVLGRRMGLRKAALSGGLIATLPDLDVFWPSDGPVESFVTHRGASHSLIIHTLVTPLIGELLLRLFRDLKNHRAQVYVAVFLCLVTHAILDSLTIYGTQLFWPLWKEPVGLASIFIIDPLYTVPLLGITIWALIQKDSSIMYQRCLIGALAVSTLYLCWGVAAQSWAAKVGKQELSKWGVDPTHIIATPVPLSTLFWRVIATDRLHEYSIYIPLLGGKETITGYRYERIPQRILCWAEKQRHEDGHFKMLADFADNFYRLDLVDQTIRYSDLRMGLSKTYAFQFDIAQLSGSGVTLIPSQRAQSMRRAPGDFEWLKAGITGHKMIRPIDEKDLVKTDGVISSHKNQTEYGSC